MGTLTDQELTLRSTAAVPVVAQAREAYLALCAVPCTACQYCLSYALRRAYPAPTG